MAKSESLDDLRAAKRQLRTKLRTTLSLLDTHAMDEESSKICQRILDTKSFRRAKQLGIYIHCSRLKEVNTSWIVAEAFEQGKDVFCPRVVDKDGRMELLHVESVEDLKEVPPYGILEPTENYEDGRGRRRNALETGLDLLLVPGLGFDKNGGRLGRGKGYYDTFIRALLEATERDHRPPTDLIGLAYACQMIPGSIPVGTMDAKLDFVATHATLYNCRSDAI